MKLVLPAVVGLAALVTITLFIVIARLIAPGISADLVHVRGQSLNFVRLKQEPETVLKKRVLPKRPAKLVHPDRAPVPLRSHLPPPSPLSGADNPVLSWDLGRAKPGTLMVLGEDGDATPLFRMPPLYPIHAERAGFEGWVDVEFTILRSGRVVEPRVLAAEPPRVFDQSAVAAVLKWKYRPKVEGGVPVRRPGVRVRIRFELEDR